MGYRTNTEYNQYQNISSRVFRRKIKQKKKNFKYFVFKSVLFVFINRNFSGPRNKFIYKS